ncbi:alpha/beta hydrolase family protein [Pseudoduganella namucuonensis]|uniref:Predicted dienelactone hydrolase n=1 Tax=Pseudoduganella namucuonensis TaxID=1035707 RepID=A0A1I7LHY7_9BURK|nr:hypothetical protein [Pseudoduganella namucuonensis]SFV09286.1 Predicted dienelactone hydrolase [Pseudoduganella namucuonensis]
MITRICAAAACLLLFRFAAAAPVQLPAPDGPHRVGMARFDVAGAPAYVWYPAAAGAKTSRPYFNRTEQATQARAIARNQRYGETELDGLESVIAHSGEDATPLQGKFPLVLFNHGYECYPQQNTVLMERWASHGYIVVSISHPGDAADLALADGRVVPTSGAPVTDATFGELRRRISAGATHEERTRGLDRYAAALPPTRLGASHARWSDDVRAALGAIESGRTRGRAAAVFGHADTRRVAIAGMSFGGAVAASVCRAIAHCGAAINLDGSNYDPALFDADIGRPLLVMQADPAYRNGSPNDYAYERWREAGNNPHVVRLRLDGVRHMGFTDLGLLLPGGGSEQRFGRLDAQAAQRAIGDATLAFLDQYLKGAGRGAMARAIRDAKELHVHDPVAVREWAARGGGRP